MLEKYRSSLYELGLSEIQVQIYDFILTNNFGTIDKIKEKLNYSYSQVQYNLSTLVEMGLIFTSKGEKKKRYYKIEPKIALTRLFENKYGEYKETIRNLDMDVKAFESSVGKCIKSVSFYHYDDLNLGIQNYFNLIHNAKKEIVISSIPPDLLNKIEAALSNAFLNGVDVTLYYSQNDFEEISNYLETITEILSRIGINIIEVKEKTCQLVRYNDIIVNSGFILIDEMLLNSFLFIDNEIFHFDGFYGPNFVQSSKKMFEVKTVLKRITIDYPDHIQNVYNLIKSQSRLKTSELSQTLKLGGSKLKEALEFLIKKGKIVEETNSSGVGRPSIHYSLVK